MLARAGFLDGYEFNLHWENQPAFPEEFPDLKKICQIYVSWPKIAGQDQVVYPQWILRCVLSSKHKLHQLQIQ
ncbi:MAG: hypothetical protein CML33_01400 [Rhodobacteraceae bacterium]|nr:hypothetical protein [Paracoccaceae bacterium]